MLPSFGLLATTMALDTAIANGVVDESILKHIIPNNLPIPDEDSHWDYKLVFPTSKSNETAEKKSEHSVKMAHLIKDAVAFYNSYGGYIVVGVSDDYEIVGFKEDFDCGDFCKRISGFTRHSIDCKFRILPAPGREGNSLGLLYIPKRPQQTDPIQFLKAAPPDSNGRRAFEAQSLYMRVRDECRPATTVEDLKFLFSDRMPQFQNGKNTSSFNVPFLDNNLPSKDPNLIKFVGRESYLENLWRWYGDRFTALKLLSGSGGVGKTSIAREFCETVGRSPPTGLEKIVWLTAKKKTYAALLGKYVEIGTTHFDDLHSLIKALLSELGLLQEEIDELDDHSALIDAAIATIKQVPCLLVVDDVDSLPVNAQHDVFRTISIIFDRVVASGQTRARALLTARLGLGAAPAQLLPVTGLPLEEFKAYVQFSAEALNINLTEKHFGENHIDRLHKASSGSPLFAASILRLLSLGENVSEAIRIYKDAEGMEVRRFAFEREIGELNDTQLRALYAILELRRCNLIELQEVTETNRTVLRDDIARLRDFHLISSSEQGSISSDGSIEVEVSGPIIEMSDLIRKKLHNPSRTSARCASLRRQTKNVNTDVGRVIKTAVAFWTDNDFPSALDLIKNSIPRNPNSPDLRCMLGRAYMKITPPDLAAADVAFRKAKELGCERPELLPLWLEVKQAIPDWVGALDLAKEYQKESPSVENLLAIGKARLELGEQRMANGDLLSAADQFRTGLSELKDRPFLKSPITPAPLQEIERNISILYVNAVDRFVVDPQQKIEVWDACMETQRLGFSSREIWFLATKRLHEWWEAVKLRPHVDDSSAQRLNSELTRLRGLVHASSKHQGSDWLKITKYLHMRYRDLCEELEIYLERLRKPE